MLRQPVRTLLLMLLIATASFTFVMRAVEYTVVRDRISEISELFQNTGILTHRDGITADVSEAMAVIAENPYVGFYDRRRGFEGTLADMPNAYIEGSRYWRAMSAYHNAQRLAEEEPRWFIRLPYLTMEYIELLPRLRPMTDFAGFVSGDSFFYGELLDMVHVRQSGGWGGDGAWGRESHILLYVQVDDVLQGYPERLYEGQVLRLRLDVPEDGSSPFGDMEIGQRYFFKGTFYFMLDSIQVMSRTITKFIQPLDEAGLWYIPVAPGETVDTVALGLCRQLEFARHAQSAVYLRTTRDMTAMPYAQEGMDLLRLREGRFLDLDDYLNARPVIVVHRNFASRRGVGIGDTITINVNADQHLVYSPYYVIGNTDDMNPFPEQIRVFPELGILSTPGAYPTVALELEVVGIFDLLRRRVISTDWSSVNKFMYIPDSLIPDDWGLQSAHFGEIGPDYVPALWYSFVLRNPRDQVAFLWDTRDALGDMGFRASFVGRDGSDFWPAADTVLLSITFNLIMFSVVLALVLALTVALFLWQRKREYAILRSLGCSAKRVFTQTTVALLSFSLPAVLVGSIGGWFFAIGLFEDTIAGFAEIIVDTNMHLLTSEREVLLAYYMELTVSPVPLLTGLCIIVLAVMLAFLTIGNLKTARMSVLETLQGARK